MISRPLYRIAIVFMNGVLAGQTVGPSVLSMGKKFANDGTITPPREPAMRMHERSTVITSSGKEVVLSASVTSAPDGTWVTEVELGDGATISNRFTDEWEARTYPERLASWLHHRQRS